MYADTTHRGISNVSNDISHAVTAALVLHPIACGLTFLAFVLSLFMLVRRGPDVRSRMCSGITLAASILAAVLTTIVFLIDVIFVAVVRQKLNVDTNGEVKATWGVAVSYFLYRSNSNSFHLFKSCRLGWRLLLLFSSGCLLWVPVVAYSPSAEGASK